MNKGLNYEPIYCAQDFREWIGYKIEDVISDEYDRKAKLVLQNGVTGEQVIIDLDKSLDGETLFAARRQKQERVLWDLKSRVCNLIQGMKDSDVKLAYELISGIKACK